MMMGPNLLNYLQYQEHQAAAVFDLQITLDYVFHPLIFLTLRALFHLYAVSIDQQIFVYYLVARNQLMLL